MILHPELFIYFGNNHYDVVSRYHNMSEKIENLIFFDFWSSCSFAKNKYL